MLTPLLTFFGKQQDNNTFKRSPPHFVFNGYLDKQDSGLKGLNGAETIIHYLRLQRPVRLVLSQNELGNEGCVALFDYLCSNEGRYRHLIEEISLNANGIGDRGLLAIAKYLNGNTSLGSLYLQNGDRFVMFRFTVALNRSNLHTLSLTSNPDLGQALTDTFLPNLSAPNLIDLHLSVCSLGPEAIPPLLSYLTSPRAVRLFTLKLNGNNFGPGGIETILNSIERHNWSLSWLEMRACGVNYDLMGSNNNSLWKDFEKQLRVRILDRNKYLANETAREALYLLPHARPALLLPNNDNDPAEADKSSMNCGSINSTGEEAPPFSRIRVLPTLVSARSRLPLELVLHILSYLAPTLSPAQLARVCAYAEDRTTLPSLSVRLSLPTSSSLSTAGSARFNISHSHGRLNPYLDLNVLWTPAVIVGDINSNLKGISQQQSTMKVVDQRKAWLRRVGCDRCIPVLFINEVMRYVKTVKLGERKHVDDVISQLADDLQPC
ncbi:hypothetical protein Clacol_009198 [Clathrus columnatus]|uniref:RNI-like protein n=1 Tax=Clathrus columnatus TaxID=1419009 RepID=A0AAV5AN39_9AGAM|nr:hypothetical protein Clacol_009198 [Clathrus columnatus]